MVIVRYGKIAITTFIQHYGIHAKKKLCLSEIICAVVSVFNNELTVFSTDNRRAATETEEKVKRKDRINVK